MPNSIDDVRVLLKKNISPDSGILLDDGEYYIQEDSETSGMLFRHCDPALLQEDDAECHGGYHRRQNGIWIIGFATKEANSAVHVSGEADDKEHAIAVLWLQRHLTVGYKSGSEEE